jgi:hypothetical protein
MGHIRRRDGLVKRPPVVFAETVAALANMSGFPLRACPCMIEAGAGMTALGALPKGPKYVLYQIVIA